MVADEETTLKMAVEADRRNATTSGAYADWLDEHDRPEEAAFFRSRTLQAVVDAEDWLADFMPTGYRRSLSPSDRLALWLAVGRIAWIEEAYDTGADTTLSAHFAVARNVDEFFRHWAVAAGVYAAHASGRVQFFCSC